MSCLLMGLGHPTLLPGGWTRLGLFPAPLCLTPRPGLACLPATLSLPSAWRAGAWDSARGALGLLTHRLRSPRHALGKELTWGMTQALEDQR